MMSALDVFTTVLHTIGTHQYGALDHQCYGRHVFKTLSSIAAAMRQANNTWRNTTDGFAANCTLISITLPISLLLKYDNGKNSSDYVAHVVINKRNYAASGRSKSHRTMRYVLSLGNKRNQPMALFSSDWRLFKIVTRRDIQFESRIVTNPIFGLTDFPDFFWPDDNLDPVKILIHKIFVLGENYWWKNYLSVNWFIF